MKKYYLVLMILLLLVSLMGCKTSTDKIEKTAYDSLSKYEKEQLSNKEGKVKKIKSLPDNATVTDEHYNSKTIYSVTFHTKFVEDNFIVFVDGKKRKKIGVIMRK